MQDTLEGFIDAYQAYEALVVKEQIEYLRQRKYRPIASTFHYYWRDPCPIMGSGLLDYYRRRYQVYDTFMAVYGRVLISLERDTQPYVIGRPKVYDRGSTFVGRVWVTSDFTEPIEGTRVSWQISRPEGDVLAKNDLTWTVSSDGAEVVDEIVWPIPSTAAPGDHRVEMRISTADGAMLSTNHTDLVVH